MKVLLKILYILYFELIKLMESEKKIEFWRSSILVQLLIIYSCLISHTSN